MRGNTVYLEAPDRTQELLNIKWALRSAGYAVASTWHEGTASTSLLTFRDHWNAKSVEQLKICDSLVVISGNGDRSIEEVALIAGFAIACGLTVFWVGSPIKGLCDFPAVRQFNTVAEFEKHIARQPYSQPIGTGARLAA
jgi:hypothetical protein